SRARSVTATKAHRCWLDEDGVRQAASRMRSRSPGAMSCSVKARTLRLARMASHVSMPRKLRRQASGCRGYPPTVVAVFETMADEGHEQVVWCHDSGSGLRAIVAIHSTALGPALGGAR